VILQQPHPADNIIQFAASTPWYHLTHCKVQESEPDNWNCDQQWCNCGIDAGSSHPAADGLAVLESGSRLLSSCYDASAAAQNMPHILLVSVQNSSSSKSM